MWWGICGCDNHNDLPHLFRGYCGYTQTDIQTYRQTDIQTDTIQLWSIAEVNINFTDQKLHTCQLPKFGLHRHTCTIVQIHHADRHTLYNYGILPRSTSIIIHQKCILANILDFGSPSCLSLFYTLMIIHNFKNLINPRERTAQ